MKPSTFIIFSLTFLLTGITVSGQANLNKTAIKLYTNFCFTGTETSLSSEKEAELGYFTPSVAFFLPGGNYQEVELTRLLINRTDRESFIVSDSTGISNQLVSGELTTNILISFRYEYNLMFLKKNADAKLKPYLGFSVNPYYSKSKFSPKVSTSFPTNEDRFGASFSIIPRLIYNLNENWFLDLNVPVSIIDISYSVERIQNPTLPLSDRTTSTIELSEFPAKFLIRIGVGLRL